MIHQRERDEKNMDAVLMRDDATLDTSPPSEVKVKNKHVQEVEEWIARLVKETRSIGLYQIQCSGQGRGKGHQ